MHPTLLLIQVHPAHTICSTKTQTRIVLHSPIVLIALLRYATAVVAARTTIRDQAATLVIAPPQIDTPSNQSLMLCCDGHLPFPPSDCTCDADAGRQSSISVPVQ